MFWWNFEVIFVVESCYGGGGNGSVTNNVGIRSGGQTLGGAGGGGLREIQEIWVPICGRGDDCNKYKNGGGPGTMM